MQKLLRNGKNIIKNLLENTPKITDNHTEYIIDSEQENSHRQFLHSEKLQASRNNSWSMENKKIWRYTSSIMQCCVLGSTIEVTRLVQT